MAMATTSSSVVISRFLDELASGGCGVVYRARDRRSGEIVAIKCIRSYRDDCGELVDRSDFDREVAAMEACRGHPYIVQLRAHGRCDDGEAVLVMEFVGPTLRHVLRRERSGRTQRSELEVRVAMRQLLSGAKRMHDAGLMHRDLKPDNVLVDARGNLKICDLGLSQSTAEPPPYSNPIGTRWYGAPEILLGSTDYDERVDAWSLGCIMAELLARKPLALVDRSDFDREVAAMEVCRGHPYIVQPRAHGRCDDGEAVLVMEFVGPTLRQVLRRERGGRTRRSELEVRVAMRQLLSGAKRMHDAGLMHRDLKPDNVLVDARGNLKICDLGLSQSTAEPPPYSNPIGTRWYGAPEILLGSTDYDERVDAWSLGCIMAELLARKPLALGEIVDVLGVNDIKRWRGYKGQRLLGGCGPDSFLRGFFPSPADARMLRRPPLSEAGFEVLSGLLTCNPEKRMTVAQALRHRWFKEADSASLRHRR
uniref:[RNA-polymerase]-subunit kinase n=1 Tax=Oryza nivara TaxID=4536 RepID=A0A0E0J9N4_ORYNI